jgi:hypothetical protein
MRFRMLLSLFCKFLWLSVPPRTEQSNDIISQFFSSDDISTEGVPTLVSDPKLAI